MPVKLHGCIACKEVFEDETVADFHEMKCCLNTFFDHLCPIMVKSSKTNWSSVSVTQTLSKEAKNVIEETIKQWPWLEIDFKPAGKANSWDIRISFKKEVYPDGQRS